MSAIASKASAQNTISCRHSATVFHSSSATRCDAMREQFPVATHPVALPHEVTGRRHLYVNRHFTTGIVGLPDEESRELLENLALQSDYPEYQCRFSWRNDSVAFWDNRAVQHYATSDYWPEPRVMERASIPGGRPMAYLAEPSRPSNQRPPAK